MPGAASLIRRVLQGLDPVFERCALCAVPLRERACIDVLCPECARDLPQRTTGYCPACGAFYENNDPPYACGRCRREPPPYAGLGFYSVYDGTLRELLLEFKFRSGLGKSRLMRELLAKAVGTHFVTVTFDLIVPVPAHLRRLLARGFNQSMVLARLAGRLLAVPVDGKALVRTRNTPPQSGLTRRERESNLQGAFAARQDRCRSRRILLVDDVATTGSTLAACAKELNRAGAASVHALVVAKA
jgi:ComF family protein